MMMNATFPLLALMLCDVASAFKQKTHWYRTMSSSSREFKPTFRRGHRIKFLMRNTRGKIDYHEFGYVAEPIEIDLGDYPGYKDNGKDSAKRQIVNVWPDFPLKNGEVREVEVRNIEQYAEFCHDSTCRCADTLQQDDRVYQEMCRGHEEPSKITNFFQWMGKMFSFYADAEGNDREEVPLQLSQRLSAGATPSQRVMADGLTMAVTNKLLQGEPADDMQIDLASGGAVINEHASPNKQSSAAPGAEELGGLEDVDLTATPDAKEQLKLGDHQEAQRDTNVVRRRLAGRRRLANMRRRRRTLMDRLHRGN